MQIPIFIPSKGRSHKLNTLSALGDANTLLVVEPQEAHRYSAHNTIVLPINNGGITYVRNFIKQYTEDRSIYQYWMLDDDINNLYHREGKKMVKNNGEVLNKAAMQFMAAGVALGALEYQQFAWSATKPLILNSFCDVCVWVDNTKTYGMRYDHFVEGKEDRDFAMQMVKAGLKTARTTLYAFAAPSNGSNEGGLKEIFYDAGKELQCVANMVTKWGEKICTPIVKDSGRKDVKINWQNINMPQSVSLF